MINKLFLLSVFVVGVSLSSFSQSFKRIKIKAGEDIVQKFSPLGFYRFDKFKEGNFYMKNGRSSKARFNYNLLSAGIQFIGNIGDTLVPGDPVSIDRIEIGDYQYIYENGYYEVTQNFDSIKLARKIKVTIETEKIGGYDQPAPTSSIAAFNNAINGVGGVYNLVLNEDVTVTEQQTYFWIDRNKSIIPVTKTSLSKLFPSKQKQVKAYFDSNHIDINSEDDLKKWLAAAVQQ